MLTFSELIMYITIYTIIIFLVCNYLDNIIILGFISLLILFGLVIKFIEECSGGEWNDQKAIRINDWVNQLSSIAFTKDVWATNR